MKTIDTLIEDIYAVLDDGVTDGEHTEFGDAMSDVLGRRLDGGNEHTTRLRLSNAGSPCSRQLWYKIHTPDDGEGLQSHVRLKFLYGDILETLLLELAHKAGHLVEGEQECVLLNGVEGHIDCIIDGMLVDIKSASSYSFAKFKSGLQRDDDSFGYLSQLGSYLLALREAGDPRLTEYTKAAFLVVDKVTGNLTLDVHEFTDLDLLMMRENIEERISDMELEEPPSRAFDPIPQNKPNAKGWRNGNMKLAMNCSYCAFKNECFPELRTFLYANKPVFLTHVEVEPNVLEVT